MGSQMGAQRNAVETIQEIEIRRSIVDRVSAENDQHLHPTGLHVSYQFTQRLGLAGRCLFGGLIVAGLRKSPEHY